MRIRFTVALIALSIVAKAQFDPDYREKTSDDEFSRVNFGLGMGINYGGLGARLEVLPVKYLSLFCAAGFNLHKAGINAGGKGRLLPDKKLSPVLQFMYGYNAVIVVIDADQYNKTYYGPTFGGGVELKVGQNQNFMEFGLLIPIRDPAFAEDIQELQNLGVQISEPLPFGISFGYHFKF